jgi:hypothetical protein
MENIFKTTPTEQYLERFEIIFDRAKTEKAAKSNAVDYYLTLVEDENVVLDVEEVIELAEMYGYDLSDFEQLVEENK